MVLLVFGTIRSLFDGADLIADLSTVLVVAMGTILVWSLVAVGG